MPTNPASVISDAARGCRVTENAPLAAATTFRIGGPADLLIDAPDTTAAAAVIAACRQNGVPLFYLGNGSNLLVGDHGIRGVVLRLDARGKQPETLPDGTLRCDAGLPLQKVCLFAKEHALTGLEFAYGIPGTVGGAVYMNAGAYGGEMADVIAGAEALDADGHPVTLSAEELALGYRHSALMERGEDDRLLLTAVTLRLSPGNAGEIAARMTELLGRRREKQPLDYPSAGSFFKRPEGYFAGALIEGAGLKGYRVGGAAISDKHAGFVINCGGATAADVRQLCRDVQERILQKDGVRLEPEVRFIGEF